MVTWRKARQPTPECLPGESCGQRSLLGCCPWARTESDKTAGPSHTHTVKVESESASCSVVSSSSKPHGKQPARPLCPWDSPGENTRVGCRALLQGIFPTQGWNLSFLCVLSWQEGSVPLSYPGSWSHRQVSPGGSLVSIEDHWLRVNTVSSL